MPSKSTIENPWDIKETAFAVYVNSDEEYDVYNEAELEGLCEAANVDLLGSTRQRIKRGTTASYIGSGKLIELQAYVAEAKPDFVLFDCELSGIQGRNVAEALDCKVIDRTQLILDIFARRARTREGKLQVELAQLTYMMPRLMSVYTKFERQRGGIGMRGPGETKLEADRRMIKDRIGRLRGEIEDVRKHRIQQREARRKFPFPFATIVGYTSAGKSTLMNRISGTDLLADAMPFATLDPTTRKVDLDEGYSLFLTDTVGFISNLPTLLVASFRATLEEINSSDFILHVVDIGHPMWEIQMESVNETLELLAADEIPTITVFNKCDLIKDKSFLNDLVSGTPNSVAVSALNGIGMPDLVNHLVKMTRNQLSSIKALIPYDHAGLVEKCYQFGRVTLEDFREDGVYIEAMLVHEMRELLAKFEVK